jgi:hypothetical protein
VAGAGSLFLSYVFLYAGGATAERVNLGPGEIPTAELLCLRCRSGQWEMVSDWRPAG